jgi:hypothetical protein
VEDINKKENKIHEYGKNERENEVNKVSGNQFKMKFRSFSRFYSAF